MTSYLRTRKRVSDSLANNSCENMVRRSQVSGLSVPGAEGNNEVHGLLHMDPRQ